MSDLRHCCVLSCMNDSNSTKIFVPVPSKDENRRRKWIEEIGRPTTVVEKDLFCCEDHFYFPEDCSNYDTWLENGGHLILKETVIPRFNLRKGLPFYSRLPQGLLTLLNKWCFVPGCDTVPNVPPYKILFPLPEDLEIRKCWFYAIRKSSKPGALFCCEDHFDVTYRPPKKPRLTNFLQFTKDIVDFKEYLISGCALEKLQLKKGVLPHLNLINRLLPCGREKLWVELRKGVQDVPTENKKKLNFQVEITKIQTKISSDEKWKKYIKRSKAVSKSWFEKHQSKLFIDSESDNYGGYKRIKIVVNKQGGDLLVYLGYTFCQSHVQKCGRIRWRCSGRTRKFCMSQLITEADKVTPIPGSMKLTHNHPPVFPNKNMENVLVEKMEEEKDDFEGEIIEFGRNPENPRHLFLQSLSTDIREMNDFQFKKFKDDISKIIAEVG